MSHFTKIKTKLANKEIIKKALSRIGLKFEEGNFKITQYGKTEKAELKLDKAVGLSLQKDGTWAMVGDFYHAKTQSLNKYYNNTKQFSADVNTAYAIEQSKSTLEDKQFFCSENEEAKIGSDGLIRMVFENYG